MAVNGVEFKSPENKRWAQEIENELSKLRRENEFLRSEIERIMGTLRALGGAV